jgi:hypothetical protein
MGKGAGGAGAVLFGWIIWQSTGNIFIGLVVAFVAWPIISALFGVILDLPGILYRGFMSLFEPEVTPKELSYPLTDDINRGVRFLIITKGETQFNSSLELLSSFEKVIGDSIKRIWEIDHSFKHKFNEVVTNKLPIKVYGLYCKRIIEKSEKRFLNFLTTQPFVMHSTHYFCFSDGFSVPGYRTNKIKVVAYFDNEISEPSFNPDGTLTNAETLMNIKLYKIPLNRSKDG